MTSAINQSGNYTQVGTCPKCGAPLYAQSFWHGVTPPPITYSCTCRLGNYEFVVSPNTFQGTQNKSESLEKKDES